MAEITEFAYQKIRQHIVDNWNRVGLLDEAGETAVNYELDDERITWEYDTTKIIVDREMGQPIYEDVPSGTLTVKAILKGSDSGFSLPITVAGINIFDDVSNEVFSEESFEPFTLEQDEDEITVTHNIEVPKL